MLNKIVFLLLLSTSAVANGNQTPARCPYNPIYIPTGGFYFNLSVVRTQNYRACLARGYTYQDCYATHCLAR